MRKNDVQESFDARATMACCNSRVSAAAQEENTALECLLLQYVVSSSKSIISWADEITVEGCVTRFFLRHSARPFLALLGSDSSPACVVLVQRSCLHVAVKVH